MHSRNRIALFVFLLIAVVILFVVDVAIGSVYIPFLQIIKSIFSNGESAMDIIVLQSRLPRVITAILVGMSLPVAGLLMQTYFKNPIAGPDILGITSGASLAVAIFTMGAGISVAGILPIGGSVGMIISGIVGSMIVLFIMLAVSKKISDSVTLLVFGIMLGMAISAFVGLLQYFSEKEALKIFVLWSFGSLSGVTWSQLYLLAPIVIISVALAFSTAKKLNMLLPGETYAKSLGLNTGRIRILLIGITGLLTGAVTAFCGPIAFIGIAISHVSRMLFKTTNHFILMPACVLCGIISMLLCDMISQTPGYNLVLPINTVTALLGAPFVIFILMQNNKFQRYF